MCPWRFRIILFIAAAAGVYLAGNGRTQLFDRDEPRYAQCSRQMLQSGDWVVPRLYDKIRAAKPPGIYWCQSSFMSLLGDNAFAARLPSSLAAILTLSILATVIWRTAGPRHAFWTIFVFGTSLLTIWSAKVCMTDAVLLLWTTGALLCLYALWRGRGGWVAIVLLGLCIGCAGLVKGPFVLGVLAGTVGMLLLLAAIDRWRGLRVIAEDARSTTQSVGLIALKAMVVALVVAAVVVPWLWLVTHRQPDFLRASTQDAMQHLESGAEGHKGPPGYHLALIWFTFLPWSILLPLVIGMAVRNRQDPRVRFALAAVLGTWIFVEILQTKLPHYILPAFPALAYLTADALLHCFDEQTRDLRSRGIRVASVFWGMAALGLSTVPWWWLAFRFHDYQWATLIALTVFGIAYTLAVCGLFLTGRPRPALLVMGVGALVLAALLFGVYFPQSQPLRLSTRVAQLLKEHDVTHPGQVQMLDYKEPSLAFAQGGTIREAKHSLETIEHLETAPPWMVVTGALWEKTPADIRSRLRIVGPRFSGLDYSESLSPVELMVVRNRHSQIATRE